MINDDIYDTLSSLSLAVKQIRNPFDDCVPCKPGTNNAYTPKRIIKNNNAMIVFWNDGTKTIVKRASDELDSDYAAFTAALGIQALREQQRLKTHCSAYRGAEAEEAEMHRCLRS